MRSVRITAYLLREGVKGPEHALRDPGRLEERPTLPPEDEGTTWRLYAVQKGSSPVRWLTTLQAVTPRDAPVMLFGQSAGAVLLVETAGRLFAVTFGTGFHAVNQTCIEPDFGLKVAANCIDPEKVSNAEARGLGKGGRNAVSTVPVPNEMFTLRLLTDEEVDSTHRRSDLRPHFRNLGKWR